MYDPTTDYALIFHRVTTGGFAWYEVTWKVGFKPDAGVFAILTIELIDSN